MNTDLQPHLQQVLIEAVRERSFEPDQQRRGEKLLEATDPSAKRIVTRARIDGGGELLCERRARHYERPVHRARILLRDALEQREHEGAFALRQRTVTNTQQKMLSKQKKGRANKRNVSNKKKSKQKK